MPLIRYEGKAFKPATMEVIDEANAILHEYDRQGFDLTLRQLYYQFVSRGLIANKQREYDRLGSIVNDARLAGLIDWHHIIDRTRNVRSLPHWDSPGAIVRGAARGFAIDKWESQPVRCEVWIEKDALVGVIASVCERLDVPYFSCRGYVSQSEMWSAAQRLGRWVQQGTPVRVFHLGDHDPSGIDMTRDIDERLFKFIATDHYFGKWDGSGDSAEASVEYVTENVKVDRLALNMDQIEQYDPPPNPAKLTDSRGAGYVEKYGSSSWELDALEPSVLSALIEGAVLAVRDDDAWNDAVADEDEARTGLTAVASRWSEVSAWLKENPA